MHTNHICIIIWSILEYFVPFGLRVKSLISGKARNQLLSLFLLRAKMFSISNILGFFKVQFFKKELKDQVDFLHVDDKHQRFLQVDPIVFDSCGQGCWKYPKLHIFNIFYMDAFLAAEWYLDKLNWNTTNNWVL